MTDVLNALANLATLLSFVFAAAIWLVRALQKKAVEVQKAGSVSRAATS